MANHAEFVHRILDLMINFFRSCNNCSLTGNFAFSVAYQSLSVLDVGGNSMIIELSALIPLVPIVAKL
jgi:hypothetical protein